MSESKTPRARARTHPVYICMSGDEYAIFSAKVKKSGLTQREFVTAAVMGKEINSTDYGREVIYELSRIGNNLNQVVKNFYVADATAAEVMEAVRECKKVIELVKIKTAKVGLRDDDDEDDVEDEDYHADS